MENNSVNLNSALSAIQSQTEEFQREKTELARGPKGDIGSPGLPGRDGRDAPAPKLSIGEVRTGNAAAAIRQIGDAEFVLDLVLPVGPKGERGEPSTVPGPMGPQGVGVRGRDGEPIRGPKGDTGATPEVRIGKVEVGESAAVKAKPFERGVILDFTFPKPKDGVDGRQGEPGRSGLSKEEIRNIVTDTILKTLGDAGVLTEQAEKLVKIRHELKRKIHEVDNRQIGELSSYLKRIDSLF